MDVNSRTYWIKRCCKRNSGKASLEIRGIDRESIAAEAIERDLFERSMKSGNISKGKIKKDNECIEGKVINK